MADNKMDGFFYSGINNCIGDEEKEKKQVKRINMAFTNENYDRVKLMSKATGKSMTEFVNICIDFYFDQKPSIAQKAQDLLDSI